MNPKIVETFFKKLDDVVIENGKSVFNLDKNQLKDYEEFKTHCVNNPDKISDMINCVYPFCINDGAAATTAKFNVNVVLNESKKEFTDDAILNNFLNKYSKVIINLTDNGGYIKYTIKRLLQIFFQNLLKCSKDDDEYDDELRNKILVLVEKLK